MAADHDNDRDARDSNLKRIVEARQALMQRFKDAQARSPSVADDAPQGSGPTNRHGMPQVPVGQHAVDKWPVLDLGIRPEVTAQRFSLVVDGAVARPTTLDFAALLSLPQIDDVSDFHCVTTWSKLDVPWRGVRVATVLALAEPDARATHLMLHGSDGYSTNLSLVEATKDDVLLVHSAWGQPLAAEHGGPVRVITPQLYAWKGAKWVSRLEVMIGDRPGFWEQRGYSMTAYPWRNDRYS